MSQKKLASQLFQAVLQGDLAGLERLLDTDGAAAAINLPAPAPPLIAAVCRCDLRAAELLISKGASVLKTWKARPDKVAGTALLEHVHADDTVYSEDGHGSTPSQLTPLQLACLTLHTDMVELLASKQRMRTEQDYQLIGESQGKLTPAEAPLVLWFTRYASGTTSLKARKQLLMSLHRIEPQIPQMYQLAASRLACYKRFDLARVLLSSPFYPSLKRCPLQSGDILTALVSIQVFEQDSALDMLKFFEEEFAQQNADLQWTHILNGNNADGRTILLECIGRGRPDLCMALLEAGGSAWIPYSSGPFKGQLPLEAAASRGDYECIRALLQHTVFDEGVQLHADRILPALLACPHDTRPHLAELQTLLENLLTQTCPLHQPFPRCQGRTPLMLACASNWFDAVRALTLPLCKKQATEAMAGFKEDYSFVKKSYATPDEMTYDLARIGATETAKFDPLHQDPAKTIQSTIHCARGKVAAGWFHLWQWHEDLLHGKDDVGMTPLMLAAQSQSAALVKHLLHLGGDQEARMVVATDLQGRMAIHYTMQPTMAGNECFGILMSAGTRLNVLHQMLHTRAGDGRSLAFSMLAFAMELRTCMGGNTAEQENMAMAFISNAQSNSDGPLYELADNAGQSPLSFVVKAEWHNVIKQLLAVMKLHEPATTIDSSDGFTPLGWAVVHKKRAIGLQMLTAFRDQGISVSHALNSSKAKRMTLGMKQPLFLLILKRARPPEWLYDRIQPLPDELQVVYLQFTEQGQPTGKVLQCSPSAPVLQQNRADFEAFTLLMCAAVCGNVEELERLLAMGLLQDSERLTAGNKKFANTLAAVVWFANVANRDGKLVPVPKKTPGLLTMGHFCCIWQLLKAKCKLFAMDYIKLGAEVLGAREMLTQHKDGTKLLRAYDTDKITPCGNCQDCGLWASCKCGTVSYCSATCQRAQWPSHKSHCPSATSDT